MLSTGTDDLDRGAKRHIPLRMCALTRAEMPAEELIRFVIAPDGALVADLKRKLPGRGLWLTGTRRALEEAIRRKVFARGFDAELRIAPDFADATDGLLERSALDALSIAGKAGCVLHGFAKVERAVADGAVAALIHARNGADDGARKLAAALRRSDHGAETASIGAFTSAQLDLALGRSNVIHAALLAGPSSDGFLARVKRLERFRAGEAGGPGRAAAQSRKA